MAKGSHLFNKKARQKKTVSIDDSATKQIIVEGADILGGKYDECNALALPSKKRKVKTTSVEGNRVARGKLLSRKQKLRLEAIVARREKKKHRADILTELQKHQLPAHTLDALTPLVKVQTEGTRRYSANAITQTLAGIAERKHEEEERQASASTAGSKQKPLRFRSWSRRFISSLNQKEVKNDPKVLGFEEEVDSSSEEDSSMSEAEMDDNSNPDVDMLQSKAEDNTEKVEKQNLKSLEQKQIDEMDTSDEVEIISNTAHPDVSSTPETTPVPVPKKIAVANKPKPKVQSAPKSFVNVVRKKEIQDKRSKLPILAEEQVIMESITDNLVTVVAGETGSGKTTQIPQFLYEAGYTLHGRMIGITEPRRVAAVSMSRRVGVELNLSSKEVSYQIRYEGNASKSTKVKFMTDGVLLKEMEKDFLLSNYSAICIDEAHERSLYTDILIGLLSRCVLVRAKREDPLKLIIMSATLRVEDFVENSRLFKTPPTLIHIPARQFPVQIHFSRTTPQNYALAAFKKVVQIHKKLPPGGILVFVTGQQEVRTLVKQLSNLYNRRGIDTGRKRPGVLKQKNLANKKSGSKPDLRTFDLSKLNDSAPLASAEGDDDELSDDSDDDFMFSSVGDAGGEGWDLDEEEIPETPLHILPLYSMLSSSEQQKIFEPPPEGSRLCVISTNVAETSLTIPSIRYVVDTGKVKQKIWDKLTGVQQFSVQWESKASAEQRAGRAGRVGPGHCYRLFSSAVFDSEFEKYSTPEIQIRPVDDMMLLMKSMSIERVSNFPFPSHPGDVQLRNAENILKALGALEESSRENVGSSNSSSSLTISELGKTMARFPIGPRFAKMLALSFSTHLVSFVIALVAALSVQEIFIESAWEANPSENKKKWKAIKRQWAGSGSAFLLGDAMVALKAVGAFEYSGGSEAFCMKSGLRHKAMMEIRKLRRQLTSEVNTLATSGNEIPVDPQMKPPSDKDTILLRQILLSGLPDKIARKAQDGGDTNSSDKDFKHAYRCGEMEELVYIHNSSVLYDNDPDWIVYQEVFESTGKMYLRGVTAIEPQWIPVFCESLCRSEQILTQPPPFYDEETGLVKCHQKVSYGRQGWELPIAQCEYPLRLQKYKLFAQFLLEGQVFPMMKRWTPLLLSLPITMTKPWAKLQPRTQSFLKILTDNGIHRKEHLQNKWGASNSPSFLLDQYLEWVPEASHAEVRKSWPPIGPT